MTLRTPRGTPLTPAERRKIADRFGLAYFAPDERAPGHRVAWVHRSPAPRLGPWPLLLSWRCRCGLASHLHPPEAARETWACHVLVALEGRHGGPNAPLDDYHPLLGMVAKWRASLAMEPSGEVSPVLPG